MRFTWLCVACCFLLLLNGASGFSMAIADEHDVVTSVRTIFEMGKVMSGDKDLLRRKGDGVDAMAKGITELNAQSLTMKAEVECHPMEPGMPEKQRKFIREAMDEARVHFHAVATCTLLKQVTSCQNNYIVLHTIRDRALQPRSETEYCEILREGRGTYCICEDGDLSLGQFKDDMEIGIKHWSLAGRRRCGICGEWQWTLREEQPTLNFNFQSGTIMEPIFQNLTDAGEDVKAYKQRLIRPAIVAFQRACDEFTYYRYEDVDENILLGRYPPTASRKRSLCRRHVDVEDITSMLNLVFVERGLQNSWRAWCADERVCSEQSLPDKPDLIESKNPVIHANAIDASVQGRPEFWRHHPRSEVQAEGNHVLLGIASVAGVVTAVLLSMVVRRRRDPYADI